MTQTVSQAVEKKTSGPVAIMWTKRKHFRAVLPASVDVEAFLGTAAGALYASEDPDPRKLTLMQCAQASPDSLFVAMMRCAALGHLPGTDEFYLTPRKIKGVPQVLGIEGYRGVVERMYRSGAVAKVVVREVCAKDPFRYVEGVDAVPVHEIGGRGTTGADFFGATGSRDRGQMVGAYAYAELTTGAISRVVILTRDDVFAAREAGGWRPDDQYSPWSRLDAGKDHPEFQGRSMWWKTAAKRLEPWVPTSAEYRREQLRASAAAADQAAMRERVPDLPPEGNGRPQDIHDAEIVEEPAETQPRRRPGKRELGQIQKLRTLLTQLPLGSEMDHFGVVSFFAGTQVNDLAKLSGEQAATVTTALEEALQAAGGDPEDAAARVWQVVQAGLAQDAGEPEDGGQWLCLT
jgi:recombination protein RecT